MIYFITARSLGLVKIGYAEKAQERFHAIQSHCPVALTLERVRAGGQKEEAVLHALFADIRERGEWFRITPELEVYMSGLAEHIWKHRGWQHAARRELAASASRKRPDTEQAA